MPKLSLAQLLADIESMDAKLLGLDEICSPETVAALVRAVQAAISFAEEIQEDHLAVDKLRLRLLNEALDSFDV